MKTEFEMYNYIKLNKVPNGTSFNKDDEKDISENWEIQKN